MSKKVAKKLSDDEIVETVFHIFPFRSEYKSVREWYEDAKKNGYLVPPALCQCLSQLMKIRGLKFSEAFQLLLAKKKVVLSGKHYAFDLTGHKLWQSYRHRKQKKRSAP
jgi:hypothetical protein